MSLWLLAEGMFRMADVNDAACAFLGATRERLLGSSTTDFEGNHARGKRDMLAALRGDGPVTREIPHVMPDGDVRELRVMYVGYGTDHVATFLVDVTSQRPAEERLRETERRFRWIVETANEGIWTGDREGVTTFVNEAAAQMLGVDRADIVGRPFRDFAHYDEAAAGVRTQPRRSGLPVTAEFGLRHRDGRSVDVVASVSLLRDDAGEVIGSLALLSDVGRMNAEDAESRDSGERFAQVFEELPEGEPLAYRERQVLGLLAHGHDGPAIAERLGLAPETVRSYTQSARDKLGAKTRTEAVALALVRGQISR